MQLQQGSTIANMTVDRDSDWQWTTEQAEHKFINSASTVIQTSKYGAPERELSGYTTTKADRDALITIHQSQVAATLTADQAGDVASVMIWSLKWDRVPDIRNWWRRRLQMTLKRR